MNNLKNPYVAIINHMREQGSAYNPSSIELGIVIKVNPFTVQIGDLQLNKDNLLIADYLLENYSREIQVNGTTNTYVTQDGFKKDDLLGLVQIGNKYLVICKAVSI